MGGRVAAGEGWGARLRRSEVWWPRVSVAMAPQLWGLRETSEAHAVNRVVRDLCLHEAVV